MTKRHGSTLRAELTTCCDCCGLTNRMIWRRSRCRARSTTPRTTAQHALLRSSRKNSNRYLFALGGPELVDHLEQKNPADHEYRAKRQRIIVSAVKKIADGEERRPDHGAAGHPPDQSQRKAVAGLRALVF